MARKRVAVIGSGVSGMTAAYLLERAYDVTLFEAGSRLGGHAHTHLIPAPSGKTVVVDSAVMIVRPASYPTLMRLFGELGTATRDHGPITLSVTCTACGFANPEAHDLQAVPPRPPGVAEPEWKRFTDDAARLTTDLLTALTSTSDDHTIGDFIDAGAYSSYYVEHLLMPAMVTNNTQYAEQVRRFSLRAMFDVWNQHGLLNGNTGWRSVVGGTKSYLDAIAARLSAVRLFTAVDEVRRTADGVDVRDRTGAVHAFDKAVIATHPRQALNMLAEPTDLQAELLGAVEYTTNTGVLHTDTSLLAVGTDMHRLMNYRRTTCEPSTTEQAVSLELSLTQGISEQDTYIATYNGEAHLIAPDHRHAELTYEHLVLTPRTAAAQQRLREISDDRIAFAGAYHSMGGYHEDGCRSGVLAAEHLGVTWL
ncbi:FAD-dependent oxidoreductase [Streptomyces sp. NPDC004126]|uniref:FAD-dependent oxidoreductase n=1 Tax=Streptomyces sp. NPDC004126 TaxID=3390695 RepID=UPI003D07162F